jgi:hypothetical protein
MAFYVELPADEYGNVSMPRAVVEAHIEPGRSETNPLGNPDRQLMVAVAPPEIAQRWPSWYTDAHGGWAEVEGPARLLSREEWAALISAKGHHVPNG